MGTVLLHIQAMSFSALSDGARVTAVPAHTQHSVKGIVENTLCVRKKSDDGMLCVLSHREQGLQEDDYEFAGIAETSSPYGTLRITKKASLICTGFVKMKYVPISAESSDVQRGQLLYWSFAESRIGSPIPRHHPISMGILSNDADKKRIFGKVLTGGAPGKIITIQIVQPYTKHSSTQAPVESFDPTQAD